VKAGTSTYPSGAPLGRSYPAITVAVLDGMQHATYIVDGEVSGDSSLNNAAYTDGSAGWGAIKGRGNGHVVTGGGVASSGQGVDYPPIRPRLGGLLQPQPAGDHRLCLRLPHVRVLHVGMGPE
jgi:hypothetical protein